MANNRFKKINSFIILTLCFSLLLYFTIIFSRYEIYVLYEYLLSSRQESVQYNSLTPLSYKDILKTSNTDLLTKSNPQDIVILSTGDFIPARKVNKILSDDKDFKLPFNSIYRLFQQSDVSIINLESPLLKNCPLKDTGIKFCGSPQVMEGLIQAGINVVNVANNHIGDFGQEGINETVKLMELNKILPVGNSGSQYLMVKGTKIAFLGFTTILNERGPTTSGADEKKIIGEVMEAKKRADIVIVSFHWGKEYTGDTTQNQKRLGHLAVDAGASLVLGNHPHWIQPIEIYKKGLIVYAHGNFVFDQDFTDETRESIIGRYIIRDKRIISMEFIPLIQESIGHPIITNGILKQKLLEDLYKKSINNSNPSSSLK